MLAVTALTCMSVALPVYAQTLGSALTTTKEHLLNADSTPQNWLMYNGNYSNWHYSSLDQINKSNVKGLRVVYQAAIGGCTTMTTAGASCNEMAVPLAENGILYLTDQHNKVMAFDVTSGDRAYPLWRFDPEVQKVDRTRGIAMYGDNIIQATADARIIAIDKTSGEMVWEAGNQEVVDQPNSAEAIATRALTGVPNTYPTAGGKQIITTGMRGAGIGSMAAYDAEDEGKLLWRTHTIPQPGEANFGTWPGDKWKWGAAMPWGATPGFDPESNTLFFGTGEPSPVYDPEYRPGDNLYSISTLALDADTGKMKWYFQEVPNDQWDFDSTSSRILHEVSVDGQMRKVISNWARSGFVMTLDRTTGEFISAVPQTDNINWTAGYDEKTGKPLEYVSGGGLQNYLTPGARRGRSAEDAPLVCSTWGGSPTGIWSASYDPTSGMTYQTRTEGCTKQTITTTTDEAYAPLKREGLGSVVKQIQFDTKAALVQVSTKSAERVNRYIRDLGIPGDRQAEVGALATGGGLVFTAFDDGSVSVFDKDTLEELWRFNHGTSIKGSMMSFAVNGKQYVAHVIGGDNAGSSGISALNLPTAMLVVYGL
jgi:alcohol dehydrogenase (cytochrome c)